MNDISQKVEDFSRFFEIGSFRPWRRRRWSRLAERSPKPVSPTKTDKGKWVSDDTRKIRRFSRRTSRPGYWPVTRLGRPCARRLHYDPSLAIAVAASTADCFMLMIGSMSDAAILVLLAGRSISSLAIRPSQHTSQQRCRHSRHVPARILVSHFVFSVRILAAQTFYALRAERHWSSVTVWLM